MTLQHKLDAFKAHFRAGGPPFYAPAEIHSIMDRATAELVASRVADRALKAGDTAPFFALQDTEGVEVTSEMLLEKGALVVSFYRGDWCHYCNLELQALQAALPSFLAKGASLVAISPQTTANSRKSVRSNHLSFPILSDLHNDVAAAFGLRSRLPEYLIELYKSLNNDLPEFNDDDSWTLPMPARYVIGTSGTILYAEVNPDYTRRPEPDGILPVLQREHTRPLILY